MFCPKCGTENPETGKFCRSCGTDLSGVSKALNKKKSSSKKSSENDELWDDELWNNWFGDSGSGSTKLKQGSNDSTDLFGAGVKGVIMGFGFLAVSMALLITGVANGHRWWWAMLFPAFFSFANGVSQILKANRLEKKSANANPVMQNQIPSAQSNLNLPPTQTDYVKPQKSIYVTGDLVVPPSVTEQTTKHLEMNSEGETMTLPKK